MNFVNFEIFELGFRGENHDHLDKDDFEIFFLNPKIQPSFSKIMYFEIDEKISESLLL